MGRWRYGNGRNVVGKNKEEMRRGVMGRGDLEMGGRNEQEGGEVGRGRKK
jgi:hypothetical protein